MNNITRRKIEVRFDWLMEHYHTNMLLSDIQTIIFLRY